MSGVLRNAHVVLRNRVESLYVQKRRRSVCREDHAKFQFRSEYETFCNDQIVIVTVRPYTDHSSHDRKNTASYWLPAFVE